MAETVYEGLFILDSNRYARASEKISSEIAEMVGKCGGSMLASRLWEERRLAYPIGGHRKGTYWLAYFKLDSRQVAAVNRLCQLNENIIRALILKVDPRIVDALVGHALGRTPVVRPAETERDAADEDSLVPDLEEEEEAAAGAEAD